MATILDAFVGNLKSKLSALLEEEVMTVLGAEQELRKLQENMESINLVLQDAERKRIQSKAIAGWVNKLKDVMYDADDIVDLCRYEGGRLLEDQPPSSSTPWVRCSFPSLLSCFPSLISWFSDVRFRHEIGGRIKDLNARLDEIYQRVPALNLLQNEPDARVTRVDRGRTALVDSSEIVGEDIQRATEYLVELIVQEDREQKCPVIAVTGMGGIGKTTLAKNIFNHQKIKDGFLIKIRVRISQNYSETGLLKEMIRGAGENPGDRQSTAELVPLLQSVVSGKTLFLILDDVWRADVWNDLLRAPLQSGDICRRVLVTTRDRRVALQMGAKHIHPVQVLPLESGWDLLCRSVYITAEAEMQSLRDVGVQIVEKCHGLPLAIKAIAGVLATKARCRGEWENILRSDTWSVDNLPDELRDLRGALYLSYEDLPSPIKQCFISLSLFPEDSEFSREDVVNYWAVEGLAETRKDSFVEVADEYFEELILRNLIQHSSTYPTDSYYRMHDLLRQLACFLSRDESFCGKADELTSVSTTTTTKLRRLAITDLAVIPESLAAQKKLRTLFLKGLWRPRNDLLFVSIPCLRLLCLSGSKIDNIPEAVGNLRHLRLLDLDRTKLSSLPVSIKNLTNLQVLRLSGCRSLHTLPDGITRLLNLRVIDLRDTPLDFMPAGMGRLEQLNFFYGFSVGAGEHQEQGCQLEELASLMQLRKLTVHNLERAVAREGGHLVLRSKQHLQYLQLECSPSDIVEEAQTNNIEEVFAELFPPPCLERLRIHTYFGRMFRDWMMSPSLATSLPQLRVLYLINCNNVLHLPPLGLLPELVELEIFRASEVVTVRPDHLGSDKCVVPQVYFPKLEVLKISYMDKLEEWSFCGDERKEVIMFPCLRILNIQGCPKLKSDLSPLGLLHELVHLVIADASEVVTVKPDHLGSDKCVVPQVYFPKLEALEIRYIEKLKEWSFCGDEGKEVIMFPCLRKLRLEDCPKLKSDLKLSAVKELDIGGCESLERISGLPTLRQLDITDCPSLTCVEINVDALEYLKLDNEEMECLPEWLLGLLQQRSRPQQHSI